MDAQLGILKTGRELIISQMKESGFCVSCVRAFQRPKNVSHAQGSDVAPTTGGETPMKIRTVNL